MLGKPCARSLGYPPTAAVETRPYLPFPFPSHPTKSAEAPSRGARGHSPLPYDGEFLDNHKKMQNRKNELMYIGHGIQKVLFASDPALTFCVSDIIGDP
jgi:hypothetical protein